ncbi:hypothetical protein GTH10_18700 [Burkholderia thailandensis]|nr:hypothetical protein [Burkholderia thailandensis]NOK49361.1 hypothetical protein [Burkholderia thailandensis]
MNRKTLSEHRTSRQSGKRRPFVGISGYAGRLTTPAGKSNVELSSSNS